MDIPSGFTLRVSSASADDKISAHMRVAASIVDRLTIMSNMDPHVRSGYSQRAESSGDVPLGLSGQHVVTNERLLVLWAHSQGSCWRCKCLVEDGIRNLEPTVRSTGDSTLPICSRRRGEIGKTSIEFFMKTSSA